MTRRRPLLLAFFLCVLATACGGDDAGSGDLTGEVPAREGYVAYEGAGVSFLHPRGWEVTERPARDGGVSLELRPAGGPTPTSGGIALLSLPRAADRFDSLLDQRRVAIRSTGGGEVVSDEQVELDGAERARRVVSRKDSALAPGVEVDAQAVEVLREGGDVVFLNVEAPQTGEPPLDPEVVASSFRLTGS